MRKLLQHGSCKSWEPIADSNVNIFFVESDSDVVSLYEACNVSVFGKIVRYLWNHAFIFEIIVKVGVLLHKCCL